MCARCEELEEQLAYTRSELQAQIADTAVHDISRAFRTTNHQTLFILALYRAKGRVVSPWQLEEALPPIAKDRNSNTVAVRVSQIRKLLGADFIENAWGRGFRLSVSGMDIVGRFLGDVQLGVDPRDITAIHEKPSEELRTHAALIAGLLAHRDADGGLLTATTYRRIADRLTGQPRVAA